MFLYQFLHNSMIEYNISIMKINLEAKNRRLSIRQSLCLTLISCLGKLHIMLPASCH